MAIRHFLSRCHAPLEGRVWQQTAWQSHRDSQALGATLVDRARATVRTDFAWAQSLFATNVLPENADLRSALQRARTPAPNRLIAAAPMAPAAPIAPAWRPQAGGPVLHRPQPGPATVANEPALPSSFAMLIGLGVKVLGLMLGTLVFVPAACIRRVANSVLEYEQRGVPLDAKLPEARIVALQGAMEHALQRVDAVAAAQAAALEEQAAVDSDGDDGSECSERSDPRTLVEPAAPTVGTLKGALSPLLPARSGHHHQAVRELAQQPLLQFVDGPPRQVLARQRCSFAPSVARLLRPRVLEQIFLPEVLGLRVDGHELSPTAEAIASYDGCARYSVRVPAGGAAQPRTAREPLNLELAATLVPGTVAVGDEHAPVALRVPVRVGVRLQVAEPLAGRTGSRFAVEAVSVSFAPHPPLGLTPPPFLTA